MKLAIADTVIAGTCNYYRPKKLQFGSCIPDRLDQ